MIAPILARLGREEGKNTVFCIEKIFFFHNFLFFAALAKNRKSRKDILVSVGEVQSAARHGVARVVQVHKVAFEIHVVGHLKGKGVIVRGELYA